jgi:hypothetical protein
VAAAVTAGVLVSASASAPAAASYPPGIDHFKPDVLLMRFAAETLGRYVSPAETDPCCRAPSRNLCLPIPG